MSGRSGSTTVRKSAAAVRGHPTPPSVMTLSVRAPSIARLLKNVMERETSARRLPPARRSAEVYLQRRVAILEKQVKSLRLAAGALAEAAYLGDTLEPSDSEDEMEAESDLDNGDEEITSEGEDA